MQVLRVVGLQEVRNKEGQASRPEASSGQRVKAAWINRA